MRQADPWQRPAIDWDATLAFRRHLWGLGFKIAEAMDTSQRGLGLDWPGARELITRSLAEAKATPGADLACGVGTDQLAPGDASTLDDVVRAYEEQLAHVEAHGGRAILMASRALCRLAKGPDDYLAVYGRLIRQAKDKVILHWLGEAFDPQPRRLLGLGRLRAGDGDRADPDPRQCRQDRRHQDLAPRRREGSRDAPPPAARASSCIPATTSTMPS